MCCLMALLWCEAPFSLFGTLLVASRGAPFWYSHRLRSLVTRHAVNSALYSVFSLHSCASTPQRFRYDTQMSATKNHIAVQQRQAAPDHARPRGQPSATQNPQACAGAPGARPRARALPRPQRPARRPPPPGTRAAPRAPPAARRTWGHDTAAGCSQSCRPRKTGKLVSAGQRPTHKRGLSALRGSARACTSGLSSCSDEHMPCPVG